MLLCKSVYATAIISLALGPAGAFGRQSNADLRPVGEKSVLPISMICPAENDGVLELVGKTTQGDLARIRVKYRRAEVLRASYETARHGETYKLYIAVDLGDAPSAKARSIVAKIESRVSAIKTKICEGSPTMRKKI